VWSYPNVHGDVMATADNTGLKQGATMTYDPNGTALGILPDNSAGNFDYGWLGSAQRPIEHAGSLATIEMGARPYVPSLGRFLQADPVPGASSNAQDYCSGDPINCSDFSGLKPNRPLPSELDAPCFYKGPVYDDALFASDQCLHYRTAFYNNDSSIYYDFIEKGERYDQPKISRIQCPESLRNAAQFFGLGGFVRAVTNPDDAFSQSSQAYLSGEVTTQTAAAIGDRAAELSPYVTLGATAVDAACAAIGY